jgi:hypothetical protein
MSPAENPPPSPPTTYTPPPINMVLQPPLNMVLPNMVMPNMVMMTWATKPLYMELSIEGTLSMKNICMGVNPL